MTNFSNDFPEMGLFDVKKSDIEIKGRIVHIDKNGFFYCKKGFLEIVFEGKSYLVKENDIFVYLPFCELYIHSISDDLEGIIGVADFSFVYSSLHVVANAYNYLYVKEHPCMSLSEEGKVRVDEMISAINSRKSLAEDPVMFQLLSSLARALCFQIMYEYFSSTPSSPIRQDRKDVVFQNFMQSLYKNYTKSREVSFYAQEQFLTPRYFSSIVKAGTGRSAQQWISVVVIDEACHLLDDPKNSIKDVSYRLGFPNQSFFGRYFKQYYGMSPSEYRRSLPAETHLVKQI
ncbi:MAG: helix-turn-helix domain-containing protein [Candidatus Cryptobacteroides sp.]